MSKNLIPLQNCHASQETNKGVKSDWIVKNEKGKKIATFSKELDERQVMAAIHFGRKFELQALNIGIAFQLNKSLKSHQEEVAKLKRVIGEQQEHSDKLAEKLQKFIISEE